MRPAAAVKHTIAVSRTCNAPLAGRLGNIVGQASSRVQHLRANDHCTSAVVFVDGSRVSHSGYFHAVGLQALVFFGHAPVF